MLRLTRFAEIDPEPHKTWLVDRLLGAGELSAVFGAPGSGKSVLVSDMACHIARGRTWLTRAVAQGAVVYVAAERAALVKRRMAAWRTYHDVQDLPLAILQGAIDLRSSKAAAQEIIRHSLDLRDEWGIDLGMIVIDTVSRALAGGDENSPKDMGALVGNASLIQDSTGAHVCLIHHIPADGSQRLRGHGALLGAVDTSIGVEKGSTARTATVDKQNDGEEGERVAFTLEGVEIGPDTTAPVVIAADAPPAAKSKRPAMTKSAATALRALNEAIGSVGEPAPTSNHVPPGISVTTLDKWRDYSYRMGISASDATPRARQAAFKRASDQLIGAGIVGVWEPFVWSTR